MLLPIEQKSYQSIIMLLLLLVVGLCTCLEDISKYGAVPHSDTLQAQRINADALTKAIIVANSSANLADTSDRWVVVPKGTYYAMPVWFKTLINVTLIVEGRWAASKLIKYWPR